jgi:rhodanese-related sulfurtransferase
MSPKELLTLVTSQRPPVVLDVRSRQEFAAGHVPGAVHVPFWAVVAGAEVPGSHDELVVVYCGHGPRAHVAGAALRARGFERVEYLDGHMTRWRREGLPRAVSPVSD